MKDFYKGFLGGVVGAGVVLCVVGGVMHVHKHINKHISLPIVLDTSSPDGSKVYLFAHICADKALNKAKIIVPPFVIRSDKPLQSLSSTTPIPASLVPVKATSPIAIEMVNLDNSATVPGKLVFSAPGVLSMMPDTPMTAGGAFGLAKEAVFEYDIAP